MTRLIFKGAFPTLKQILFDILNDSKQCLGYALPAKHAKQSFDQRRPG